MASLAISASLQTVCSSHQATKKQQPKSRPAARSLGTKEATHHVVALDVKAQNGLNIEKQEKSALRIDGPEAEDAADYKSQHGLGTEFASCEVQQRAVEERDMGSKYVFQGWQVGLGWHHSSRCSALIGLSQIYHKTCVSIEIFMFI